MEFLDAARAHTNAPEIINVHLERHNGLPENARLYRTCIVRPMIHALIRSKAHQENLTQLKKILIRLKKF